MSQRPLCVLEATNRHTGRRQFALRHCSPSNCFSLLVNGVEGSSLIKMERAAPRRREQLWRLSWDVARHRGLPTIRADSDASHIKLFFKEETLN